MKPPPKTITFRYLAGAAGVLLLAGCVDPLAPIPTADADGHPPLIEGDGYVLSPRPYPLTPDGLKALDALLSTSAEDLYKLGVFDKGAELKKGGTAGCLPNAGWVIVKKSAKLTGASNVAALAGGKSCYASKPVDPKAAEFAAKFKKILDDFGA